MRNLRCLHRSRLNLDSALPCAAAWDTTNDAIVYAHGPAPNSPVIELRRLAASESDQSHTTSTLVASWDAPSPNPDIPLDHVVCLRYLAASETTCLVLAGGDIVIVRDDVEPGQDKIEIVGSVDAGIAAAAWSPDEDLLAIVTRASTFLLMTPDFDGIASSNLAPEDARLSKQVNVGWGKKETQFQGKGAKALRDPTMPDRVDEGKLSPNEDYRVALSWRGDGSFVAMSTVEGGTRRMIRVFSREGNLESVTEAVNGLEGSLSWKPSGQVICSVQRSDEQLQVVFFERNGLRHGEFALRLHDHFLQQQWTIPISLSWNIDSNILAVVFKDRIQFWTMGNYHYYLKHEMLLPQQDSATTQIMWHPEDALRCMVLRSVGDSEPSSTPNTLQIVRFAQVVTNGPMVSPNDLGYTAVVDGGIVRITPLRTANVPPPMALHEISMPKNVVDASFSQMNDKLAILHSSSISVLRISGKNDNASPPRIMEVLDLVPFDPQFNALQICFLDQDQLAVLSLNGLSGEVELGCMNSDRKLRSIFKGQAKRTAAICRTLNAESLLLLTDRTVTELRLSSDGVLDHCATVCIFPSPITRMEAFKTQDQTVVVGLTASGSLYANERLLTRNCTSFALIESHLILTTTTHLLKFAIIHKDHFEITVPEDRPDADEVCRSIERGALLVTVVPSTFAVVLQMPRGNLETIHPRALVLSGIRKSVRARQYKKAFLTCRNHRVDMNILHDHEPRQFMEDIGRFVDQLRKVEYIDLFLSQLSEENVEETIYKDPNPKNDGRVLSPANGLSKINSICEGFLTVLKTKYSTNLQNVITAHLCKSPPDIESGLEVILDLQQRSPDLVDDAVEHICFLADVNRIYEASLGIYQLDLALLIAQQSQKDPREYLPYLQTLQELSGSKRKFQIDDDLGRNNKAIEHLYQLGDIGEVEEYAMRHELHPKALQLCKYDKKLHEHILNSYASFLYARNRYKEAGVAYESLSDYNAASAAYKAANMWRETLYSAQLATPPLTDEKLRSLATSLAEDLEESKEFAEAAQIYLEHLTDLPSAIRMLCKAHNFADAFRVAALHRKPSLISELVDPGLGEGFGTLTELLSECKGQLNAQVPRLLELRTKRDEDPLAFLEGAPAASDAAGVDIPDDLSLAGSLTSTHASTLLTRYTAQSGNTTLQTGASRKTSRNKKREERKRARGKKGSVYEEEYLVNSIGRLIDRVNETLPEVERTVDALCRRGMWERAEALEGAAREVLSMCETCVPDVWEAKKEDGLKPDEEGGEEEQRALSGGERVLMDSLNAARKLRTPPVVKGYTGSALLAK